MERRESLREQADRHRAGRGLTPEQRTYVAITKWQWWTVGGPHRQAMVMANSDRLRGLGDRIDEGSRLWPDVIREAAEEARARIERFRAKRGTARMVMTIHGPRFYARRYGTWGTFQGEEEAHDVRRGGSSHRVDWVAFLARRRRWDESDIRMARSIVAGTIRVEGPIPEWLRESVRDWSRIEKARTLVPTTAERQRYRKAAGLVKPRARKANGGESPKGPAPASVVA